MNIDLRNVPFSRSGAYIAFSMLGEVDDATVGAMPAGLYLRSVHGGSTAASPGGRVALVEALVDGRPIPYEVRATPTQLDLNTVRGTLSICIAEPWVVRVRGEGVGMRLTFPAARGDFAFRPKEERWQVNCPALQTNYMLSAIDGVWEVHAPWTGASAAQLTADFTFEEGSGCCEAAIESFASVWRERTYDIDFEEVRSLVEIEYLQWLKHTPAVPEPYHEARELAAYVNWSSVVEPVGHFLRPAMFMSKNWMNNVWGWDHCFNAMALTYSQPVTAWDQLMILFDMQDEHGGLPDYVNDRGLMWNFCKPPIHGWTIGWMMQRTNFIRTDQMRQIYGPLCRWTEWWLHYRDADDDGLPSYHHGNDSGWDNATPFLTGVPLESPDLCAYLVMQMETLPKLAAGLNNPEEAESWMRRSEELMQKMLAHFWQGDHFAALRSGDHVVADTESLLLYLPLILGKRLPGPVRRDLVAGLTRPGRFLTEFGLATESPTSPHYEPDGYWRGPIWAPATLLIVEGLKECGEEKLAKDIARCFCDLCVKSGFAENFNAQTGAGLRDGAYTWTSSVFLVLAHEYLLGEE